MNTTLIKDNKTTITEYIGMSKGKIYTSDFEGAIYDKTIYGNNVICQCEGGSLIVISMSQEEWTNNISSIYDAPVTLVR